MSSGKMHDLIAWATTPCVIAGCYLLPTAYGFPKLGNLPSLCLASGYLIGSLMLSPDLDLRNSEPTRRWGLLRGFWRPYQFLVPHRSPLSHSAIFGTLFRVLYLLTPIATVIYCAGFWMQARELAEQFKRELWAGVAGMEVGAIVHLFTDGFSDAVVRPLKKIRRLGR